MLVFNCLIINMLENYSKVMFNVVSATHYLIKSAVDSVPEKESVFVCPGCV